MKKTPPIHLVDLAGPASLGDLCKGEEEDVRPVGKRERENGATRERGRERERKEREQGERSLRRRRFCFFL